MEPDRPQHDLPAAFVIAQQYSSATFVTLRVHYHKEKFGPLFYLFLHPSPREA